MIGCSQIARACLGLIAFLILLGLARDGSAETRDSASRSSPTASTLPSLGSVSAFQDSLTRARDLLKLGHYDDLMVTARRLLTGLAATSNADSLRIADVLDVIVEALWRGGKAKQPESRELAERAVAIRTKLQGPDHRDLATSLDNYASLLFATGNYAAAKPPCERALAMRQKVLGPDHPEVARSLNNVANLLWTAGDYASAKPLYERALSVYEKAFGSEHPYVARSLNNLAQVLTATGDYAGAKPLYERALAIREKTLGPDHPNVGKSLNSLAELLRDMGDLAGARPLCERALSISEKSLGPDHPDVARGLGNLAELYRATGDFAAARPLWERALAIDEKTLGPDHPDVATILNNLAKLLRDTGDYTQATQLCQRALTICEKALGPDHPDVALSLDNLATLLWATGNYAGAKPLCERALRIREKALGPDHPSVANSLNTLAILHSAAGDYAGARRLYEQALAIRENALGPDHPDVAGILISLSKLQRETGDLDAALAIGLRAEAIGREHLRVMARALPERQALGYASMRPSGLDIALCSVPAGSRYDESRRKLLDAVIRSRALVLDEVAVRHSDIGMACHVARLAESYASAQQRLANLMVRGPRDLAPERYRTLLESTRKESDNAEAALAEKCGALGRDLARKEIGLLEVASELPHGDALVAFVRRAQCESAAKLPPIPTGDAASTRDTGEKAFSYVAFVLRGGETRISMVDLGSVTDLDLLIERWREQVSRAPGASAAAERAYRVAGDALRRRIWDPVLPLIQGANRAFVVPDGALHLVSFASLPLGDHGYLVESGPLIHYLSAERDIVPLGGVPAVGRGLLALGGPAFDDRSALAVVPSAAGEDSKAPVQTLPLASNIQPQYRGERSLCAEFRDMRFSALAASTSEVEEIASLWKRSASDGSHFFARSEGSGAVAPGAIQLTGAAASEAAFKAGSPGRRVLHLATHAFFLAGHCPSAVERQRGVAVLEVATPTELPTVVGDNPLLLSGLALAGANRRDEAGPEQDDGILTAEEVAALDLSGVEWAVLSACDTGVGEVKTSEGVFGLRRAFEVAGVGTLIMSLWSVEDEAARDWMRLLYDARFVQGLGTAEAVRDASVKALLERRRKGDNTHPFYWAAFVAAGGWR